MGLPKIPARLLAVLALTSAFYSLPASAQGVISCASNGRRSYCRADTRGGVKLTRQLSGAPCRLNYSWGYDQRGIWVDRGCAANFLVVRPGPPPRPVRPVTITCISENGRRRYCAADTRRGVRLIRQRGGPPCRQGVSWGYDPRGIWVDRGCAADFQLR